MIEVKAGASPWDLHPVGPITEDAAYYSESYIDDWDDVEDDALGMGWYWAVLDGSYTWAENGYLQDGTGFAHVVDDGFVLEVQDDGFLVNIPAVDVPTDGRVTDAYYRMFVSWNGISLSL